MSVVSPTPGDNLRFQTGNGVPLGPTGAHGQQRVDQGEHVTAAVGPAPGGIERHSRRAGECDGPLVRPEQRGAQFEADSDRARAGHLLDDGAMVLGVYGNELGVAAGAHVTQPEGLIHSEGTEGLKIMLCSM